MKTDDTQRSSRGLTRRQMLGRTAGAVAATGWAASALAADTCCSSERVAKNGRINHSVCQWCFCSDCSVKPMTFDELCRHAKAMGIKSVELVDPKDWPTLKKHGLICAMTSSHGFVKGFNDKANWPMCIEKTKASIDATSAAGFPNVIVFPGFRNNIPDDVGLENMIAGIKKIIGYAEKKNVTLCVEILNSRVNVEMKGHPDYMGDTAEWCGELCKRIASPRMKMLFDIYHVQIMQGDVITRIREWKDYIGHYHTAGVPGRNELDDNQEVNYPAIMKTIVETGYTAYVGHEFIPTRDPLKGLREAVALCDV